MPEDRLIWSEEFSSGEGSVPDPKIWGRDLGDGTSHGIPGWGNNELQVYTAENAFVNADGQLELEARRVTDDSKIAIAVLFAAGFLTTSASSSMLHHVLKVT